eukprot:gene38626-47703_t
MNAAKRHEIFSRLRAANPSPKTELEYSTPFELLIAVLLSAQATDVGVNKATRRLYPVANTPQAMLDLGLDELTDYIKTIGLYKTKAKNVLATCRILMDKHGGEAPRPSGRRWSPPERTWEWPAAEVLRHGQQAKPLAVGIGQRDGGGTGQAQRGTNRHAHKHQAQEGHKQERGDHGWASFAASAWSSAELRLRRMN